MRFLNFFVQKPFVLIAQSIVHLLPGSILARDIHKKIYCGRICLFVCLLSGRPPKGEVGIPWPQSLEFSLTSEGLAFSNAPFPGQAWGTNLVLLPYAGGQA